MFEEIFFRFGVFLHGFVLAEAVATALHAGGLDSEDWGREIENVSIPQRCGSIEEGEKTGL